MKRILLLCVTLLWACIAAGAQNLKTSEFNTTVHISDSLFKNHTSGTGILKLKKVTARKGKLDFYFDISLSSYPVRSGDEAFLRKCLKDNLPDKYRAYSVGKIYSEGIPMSKLVVKIPPRSGKSTNSALSTKAPVPTAGVPLVKNGINAPKGLQGRHIALWQSHGYYFSVKENKWTWQRPCMFQTIEDLYTQSYVVPFLAPMLENAGACVILPRERDWHTSEIIIDNDPCETLSDRIHGTLKIDSGKWKSLDGGFSDYRPVYNDTQLPFGSGTALRAEGCDDASKSGKVTWWAEIPERGTYAVYVSYIASESNTTAAHYTVHALDSDRKVSVNQRIGGSTWVYIGSYEFEPGYQRTVSLTNLGSKGSVVADAVKIGGGMGCIARKSPADSVSTTSGMPRFAEGARYWMQWSGISDMAWSQNEGNDDYRDDFMSRGKWVQYLSGTSSVNPKGKGLGIPVDLSFGFHTDAGTKPDDSIVGTLAIYTLKCDGKTSLPSGGDRNTCRELTDIVQTQIVDDLRSQCDSLWNRRMLWNRSYSESRTTGTPAILLELLSHQNFEDMKYGLDPQFRFIVSRACYKGILKYLALHYNVPYVVQPLPVKDFSARLDERGENVVLSWRESVDSLESTATAEGFILKTRIDGGGWSEGKRFGALRPDAEGFYTILEPVKPGHIYSYTITASNEGGRSFPSEVLAVGRPQQWPSEGKVMIVNAFTRVSGPAWFDSPMYAGFDNRSDSGVPYGMDWSFTGEQFEFHRDIPFEGIYNTGFGASHSDYANKVVAGNSFDYPYVHGCSIFSAGYAFESASASAFSVLAENGSWSAVDIIYGKECRVKTASRSAIRGGVLTSDMQKAIAKVTANGSHIIISGCYIAKDQFSTIYPIEMSVDADARKHNREFIRKTLGYTFQRSFASRNGKLQDGIPGTRDMHFPTDPNPLIYSIEAPDALLPSGAGKSSVYLRYADTRLDAAILTTFESYKVAAFGFPLECIDSQANRDALFTDILKRLLEE